MFIKHVDHMVLEFRKGISCMKVKTIPQVKQIKFWDATILPFPKTWCITIIVPFRFFKLPSQYETVQTELN